MQDSDRLLPLVIGVTGHRNPATETVATLEQEIERRLHELDELAPETPFVMLTPLALGCDRIAARVALRFKRRRPGASIRVVGVFPFAIDDYRQDFAGSAEGAAEFESLLGSIDSWFELPAWSDARRDSRGFVAERGHRDIHYRRLGLFVALQSQVVIAMWDGVRTAKVGGTAEVVDFCLGKHGATIEGGIPFRRQPMLLASPDKAPILCIPTQREGGSIPSSEAVELARGALSGAARRDIVDLNFLNKRLAAIPPSASPAEWLDVDGAKADPAAHDAWRRLVARFKQIDSLAGTQKTEFKLGAWLVPTCAFVGVGGFQWYSSYAGDSPGLAWIPLALYAGGLACGAALWFWFSRVRRTEWTFVHARGLSEAMRIQMAWTGSGIHELATNSYFVRRQPEVAFLRAQLRAAILESVIIAAKGGLQAGTAAGAGWIKEQAEYFALGSAAMGKRRRSAAWQKWAFVALKRAVIALSILLFVLAIAEAAGTPGLIAVSADLGCFLVGTALAGTIAFGYWRDVMLDEEDLEVAARMRDIYRRAQSLIEEQPARTVDYLTATGKEALDEHADWFARHRDRLRLPEAG